MRKIMMLRTLHGDRDKETVHKRHLEGQIAAHIPEAKRTPGPERCDVVAVFVDDDASIFELHVTDWADAATLEQGAKYNVELTKAS
jgi:hypothetical protein